MQTERDVVYKEEAIPLITVDSKTNKFVVNEDAIAMINSIKGNIGVVAVAGLYRTGKSYLLNRMLLDRSSGFGVGPSINPCTKGLWIWGTPLTGQTPSGEPLNILLIDSEGIGALDQDSAHDNRVFSLTILLSSCFIYNSTGSIDENAIQNLSMIVNITKNIHLKNSGNSNIDAEEYAKYFPSFTWVLRDFALQLIDTEGMPITSKEYLERSLSSQKGTSQGAEQKNNIRKLIRTYFKDRDCFTLVRPLTKEENLQYLDRIDFDQLRPEFSRQVLALRRHVLNNMKPKTMHNKVLNGGMYTELIKSYIEAVNNGAIPNIENTWSLICRTECFKSLKSASETYESLLKDVMQNKLPLPVEELKNYHIIGKQRAVGLFKRKALGDYTEEYLKDLMKDIKLKYFNLKLENEREFNRVANNFLVKEYQAIEKKLKNKEYKAYSEFERELKYMQAHFLESGPNGPNKRLVVFEFVQKALTEGSNFFVKLSKQEIEIQNALMQEIKQKSEEEMKNMKNETLKEKQNFLQKISQLESEKMDLTVQEQNFKASIEQLKEMKEKTEIELRQELQSEKAANHRSLEEYKNKVNQNDDSIKEMERRIFMNDSEQEKQKALLKQRCEHFENLCEQISNREKELIVEIKTMKKEHLNLTREASFRADAIQKELQNKLDQQTQKLIELESEFSNKEFNYELEKKRMKEIEMNLQHQLGEFQENISRLQKELSQKGEFDSEKFAAYKEESEKNVDLLNKKVESLEKSLKDRDESLKNNLNTFEKEKSVLTQRNEFLMLQINETQSQYNEMKRAYEATLECFESVNQSTSQEETKKIQELKELHSIELRKAELENESLKKKLNQEIQLLIEKNNELELSGKLSHADFSKQIENLNEQLRIAEEEKQSLTTRVKLSDNDKLKIIEKIELDYSLRIQSLEEETETKTQRYERQIQDMQISFEESLAQLKSLHEIERDRLERRFLEERDRNENRVNNMSEEYENKMREEQAIQDDEISRLKEEIQELEERILISTQQYESDLALKQQTIDSLEEYVKETKESLANIHSSNASSLEHYLSNFAVERNQLQGKIEDLNAEISKLTQGNLALSQLKEQIESNSSRKIANLESSMKELTNENSRLNKLLEESRLKTQETSNVFLETKVDMNKEIALTHQKNTFLFNENKDLKIQIEDLRNLYEDKIRLQKEENDERMMKENENFNREKCLLMVELEKKNKIINNSTLSYHDQMSGYEKENAILQEKYYMLEAKAREESKKLSDENKSLTEQVSQLRMKFESERNLLTEDLKIYKVQAQDLEKKISQLSADYEKDQELWEGKFKFLESQKEDTKSNLADAQKKFELTLQQLQKKRANEIQELEENLNAKVAALEKRHQSQMQESVGSHQQEIMGLQETIRKLEKELKTINEKQFLESHQTIGNQNYIEKKFNEMAQNEKRLQLELEEIKAERDLKILENQRILDRERGTTKTKIFEFEQRIRDAESKKNLIVFEHEKERAKWQLEKDHLQMQGNELRELLSTLEKKKEALLRENEKLKSETKASKKSINLTSNMNNFLKSNSAIKMNPTTPKGLLESPQNSESNLKDITNKNKRYTSSFIANVSLRNGAISDDEEQI